MAAIPVSKPRYAGQDLRLIEVVRRGDVNRVTDLIALGTDVNEVDSDGVTALIMASMAGNLAVVEALLEAGAKPESEDARGYNAYRAAMFYGDFKGVTMEPFDKIMELVKIDA